MNAGLSFAEQSCLSCQKGEHGCDERTIACECRLAGHPDLGAAYFERVTRKRPLTPADEELILGLLDKPTQSTLF